jgi:hypothetical protein
MFGIDNTGSALDTVAHIIQVALTPVFLLSGIATLLNVFSTRLARVAIGSTRLAGRSKVQIPTRPKCWPYSSPHRWSLALDVAVILGAVSGAAT